MSAEWEGRRKVCNEERGASTPSGDTLMPGKGWEADGPVSLHSLRGRIGHPGAASAAWQAGKTTTNVGDVYRPRVEYFLGAVKSGSPGAGVRAISLLVIPQSYSFEAYESIYLPAGHTPC
jgi:hypothetical protein